MTTRAMTVVALVAGLAACTKRNPLYCDVPSDCETGFCDVVNHACIDSPLDGGQPDAMQADAAPDADTGVPIVQTYQQADLVLGQATFQTETGTGCDANTVLPGSIAGANGVLYVTSHLQQRVLVWSPIPTSSNASATRVIGQPNLTTCGRQAITAADIWDYGYVSVGGGKVVVTDWFRSRVLVWNPPPVGNGEAADFVLGQPNFASMATGTGANQLNFPEEIWTDGARLAVADRSNHRVLIWTTFPTTNAEAADLVLGQTGFGLGSAPTSPTQSNFNSPAAVWSDGVRFAVADGYNRVMVWNTFPTLNGQTADVVIGQPSFTTSASGLSATAMTGPAGIAGNADALFVSDAGNDRVLVFSPFPNTNGAAATYVLGQPDLNTGANNPAPTQQSLNLPVKLSIVGTYLWIADRGHNRALRFSLYPP